MGIRLYAKISPPYNTGVALLLFTRKLHCLQTFWQVIAHLGIGPYLCAKFQTCSSYGFWDTGFETEQQQQQQAEELEKWTFAIFPMLVVQF